MDWRDQEIRALREAIEEKEEQVLAATLQADALKQEMKDTGDTFIQMQLDLEKAEKRIAELEWSRHQLVSPNP